MTFSLRRSPGERRAESFHGPTLPQDGPTCPAHAHASRAGARAPGSRARGHVVQAAAASRVPCRLPVSAYRRHFACRGQTSTRGEPLPCRASEPRLFRARGLRTRKGSILVALTLPSRFTPPLRAFRVADAHSPFPPKVALRHLPDRGDQERQISLPTGCVRLRCLSVVTALQRGLALERARWPRQTRTS